ncbi:MAG TPA: circularly permuted type 2 ATP-grasp protein [Planctomycetaceae bacterium]|nr:circularly permuted type 2 ATP-grasp protein [Planctomycetaceae bacterium]
MNAPATAPPTASRSTAPGGDGLFASYAPLADVHDEMFAAPGMLRPHWNEFARRFGAMGPRDISARWEQAQRIIYENGVTYSAFGETDESLSRPWELDPVPLVMAADEWRTIASALDQRARLLNLILADLFGPQELVRSGALPSALLFGHPGFLRPYHGLRVPENGYLHLYAADLARSPDGQWWITGDRTSAPAGAGYAVENRIATSRMLPHVFRQCRVERLAPFFVQVRKMLAELAPRYRENPRIVLLTAGPASPSYFEDAYLARYLGYTLAEGADLAVRDNRVMLKTLGGLLPVEVILRRIPDEDCDPIELRGDSTGGVAGLLEVIRTGNVVVANPPGSGLVESPAFLAFLPALAQHILGEELKLPNIATWWCGHAEARQYVFDHLDELVIRPAFRHGSRKLIRPAALTGAARDELRRAIEARPAEYVAQEQVRRSTAPAWTEAGPQPWHVAVRAFVVAAGHGYLAMPGGLVRMSPTAAPLDHSMSAGERSQDLWLPADGPVSNVTLLDRPGQPVTLRRSGAELPSRVADNLFWLGRNVERTEGTARLLRTVFVRLTSEADVEAIREFPALVRALAEQGQIEPGFAVEGIREMLPDLELALPEAVFNETEPRSLRSNISQVLRLASTVRDRMSIDTWRIINRMDEHARRPELWSGRLSPVDVLGVLNRVVLDLATFSGIVVESMTRTLGWRFLEIGRRLERAWHTTALMQSMLLHRCDDEGPLLEALLETADSQMTYRSRYLATLQLAPVLDLLLTDETNPRSVAYQLVALASHVDQLPRDRAAPTRGPDERIAMSLVHTIRMADVAVLCETKSGGVRHQLDRLLFRLSDQLPKLSEAISHRFLIHAGVPRQFVASRGEVAG